MIQDIFRQVIAETPGFVELRYQDRRQLSVSAKKGQITEAQRSRNTGVAARVLVNGAWGFSATPRADLAGIRAAVAQALQMARLGRSFMKSSVPELGRGGLAEGGFATAVDLRREPESLAEIVALVLELDARARGASDRIQSAHATYHEIRDDKVVATSDGALSEIVDVKPTIRIVAAAARDGEVMTGNESLGITGELADVRRAFPPEAMAEKAARDAVDLLAAPYPAGGEATVILEPSLVGLLSHEAIGHTVEADFVLAGSIAQGKIGQRVASPLVTMVDAGVPEIGERPAGLLPVDDEGVRTSRTVIIEDGVMKSYLHNRETAALFGVEPTGNGRAFEYSDEPLIRMRNTYIMPGEMDRDALIADTKDGWLLEGAGGGQADSNAEFVFGAQRAFRIENGKVGRLHRGVTLSGQAFQVLESVDAVSRDFVFGLGSGYCGKKQRAKVDAGGPYLRCRVILGGVQR